MFLVMYDIENDKLRTHFAKFLTKFGIRIQYSVFAIKNSNRILNNIRVKIKEKFEPKFSQADSVLIYHIDDNACVGKFGFPLNEEDDLVIK